MFSGTVNWALVREHYPQFMQLTLAIQGGALAPSAVLARINRYSGAPCIRARPRSSVTTHLRNTWPLAVMGLLLHDSGRSTPDIPCPYSGYGQNRRLGVNLTVASSFERSLDCEDHPIDGTESGVC